ncbi:PREDICTED: DNA polymerase zeta catalytic subunit-like [Branchiostoma belcheri]|uniref:DNA polymerase zeta catalytic subunit n=1 Tax=Branchiostoma belcheri TaxID=7741 RepID=A0A6P4Y7G6_BRABE|nr:PREDICTED: DNA polymerase zeta catalytic subunit-like [Branchiostoma belcheri]
MFSVRIVTADHYQAAPVQGLDVCHSDFRGTDSKRVPVIRIFGATPAGQKTCLHLHGVFPYIYVPYDGPPEAERHLRQFASSIDRALNVALGRASSTTQHVFKISLVSGMPYYGYHEKEQQFMKIYFYNPFMVKKAVDLLQGGAVMNKPYQPHEAHIPFLLQFFIDYNLYGMNYINLGAVKFRRPKEDVNQPVGDNQPLSQKSSQSSSSSLPCSQPIRSPCSNVPPESPATPSMPSLMRSSSCHANTPTRQVWEMENVPSSLLLEAEVVRQSTCELEVDAVAPDILNRLEIQANIGTNPGLAAIWEDEKQRRREAGESSQIEPPPSQERPDVQPTESDLQLRERIREIVEEQESLLKSQLERLHESQAMSDDSDSSPVQSSLTPSCSVELHFSQIEDNPDSSQQMGDSEDEPIVDEDAVQSVVEMSQSFSESGKEASQMQLNSQDRSLANLLAGLADDSIASPSLVSQSQCGNRSDEEEAEHQSEEEAEEEESILMSQKWDDGDAQDEEQGQESPMAFDLEGMESSFNSSQWVDVEDTIPQVDGSADEKPAEMPIRKRLGNTRITKIRRPESQDTKNYLLNITSPIKSANCTGNHCDPAKQLKISMEKLENSSAKKTKGNLIEKTRQPIPFASNDSLYKVKESKITLHNNLKANVVEKPKSALQSVSNDSLYKVKESKITLHNSTIVVENSHCSKVEDARPHIFMDTVTSLMNVEHPGDGRSVEMSLKQDGVNELANLTVTPDMSDFFPATMTCGKLRKSSKEKKCKSSSTGGVRKSTRVRKIKKDEDMESLGDDSPTEDSDYGEETWKDRSSRRSSTAQQGTRKSTRVRRAKHDEDMESLGSDSEEMSYDETEEDSEEEEEEEEGRKRSSRNCSSYGKRKRMSSLQKDSKRWREDSLYRMKNYTLREQKKAVSYNEEDNFADVFEVSSEESLFEEVEEEDRYIEKKMATFDEETYTFKKKRKMPTRSKTTPRSRPKQVESRRSSSEDSSEGPVQIINIIVNRFKGQKELRVKLRRIQCEDKVHLTPDTLKRLENPESPPPPEPEQPESDEMETESAICASCSVARVEDCESDSCIVGGETRRQKREMEEKRQEETVVEKTVHVENNVMPSTSTFSGFPFRENMLNFLNWDKRGTSEKLNRLGRSMKEEEELWNQKVRERRKGQQKISKGGRKKKPKPEDQVKDPDNTVAPAAVDVKPPVPTASDTPAPVITPLVPVKMPAEPAKPPTVPETPTPVAKTKSSPSGKKKGSNSSAKPKTANASTKNKSSSSSPKAKAKKSGAAKKAGTPPSTMFSPVTDDSKVKYKDAMYNMAYFSSTESEKSSGSPPKCWSPSAKKVPVGFGGSNAEESLLNDLEDCLFDNETGDDTKVDRDSMLKEIQQFEKTESFDDSYEDLEYIDSIIKFCSQDTGEQGEERKKPQRDGTGKAPSQAMQSLAAMQVKDSMCYNKLGSEGNAEMRSVATVSPAPSSDHSQIGQLSTSPANSSSSGSRPLSRQQSWHSGSTPQHPPGIPYVQGNFSPGPGQQWSGQASPQASSQQWNRQLSPAGSHNSYSPRPSPQPYPPSKTPPYQVWPTGPPRTTVSSQFQGNMSPQGYSPNGNYNVQHTPPPNPAIPGQPTDQPMQQPTGEQGLQIKAEGNYVSPSPQWSSQQGGVQGVSRPPPSYEDTVKSRGRVSQQSPSSTPPQMWPSGGSQEIPMQYRRNSAPPSQQYSPNGQQPLSPPTPPTQMSPFSGYPSTNPDNWRTQYRNQYGQFQPGPRQDYSQQVPLPPSGPPRSSPVYNMPASPHWSQSQPTSPHMSQNPSPSHPPNTGPVWPNQRVISQGSPGLVHTGPNQMSPGMSRLPGMEVFSNSQQMHSQVPQNISNHSQDLDRSKCSQESTSDMFHSAYTVLNDNEDLDELLERVCHPKQETATNAMDKGNSNIDMPADDTKRPAVWESHPSIHNNLTELGPRRQRSDSLPSAVKPQLTQPKKTPTQPANRQRSQSYSQPSDLRLRGDDRNTPPKFYCEAGRPLAEVSPDRHNIVRLKLKSKLQAVRHYSNHSPQGSPRSSSSQGSPLHSPTCGPRFSPLRRMSSPAEEANKRSSILLALLRGGKTAKQIEHEKNSPMSPTSSQSSVSEGSRSSSVGKDDVNIPETPDSDQRRPDNSTVKAETKSVSSPCLQSSTTSTPTGDCSKESGGENCSNGALSETKEEASSSSELQSPEKSTENTPTAPLKDNPESGHDQTDDPTNTPNSSSDMFKSMESCNSDSKDEPSPPGSQTRCRKTKRKAKSTNDTASSDNTSPQETKNSSDKQVKRGKRKAAGSKNNASGDNKSKSSQSPNTTDKKPTPKSSQKEDAPSSNQGPGKTYPSPVEPDGTNTVVIGKDGKVWTPALKPPAVKEVVESAKNHGLGESSYQEPFCSKPTDLPDKPMEVGGRVLKLESVLPTALPTYQTELSTGGLTHWQAILASTRPTQQTQGQDCDFDLLAELQKKPEIRTAVTGDRPVVLTPCRLPPQPEKVATWLAAKTEYLRQRQLQENPSTEEREKSHEEQKSAVTDVEFQEDTRKIHVSQADNLSKRKENSSTSAKIPLPGVSLDTKKPHVFEELLLEEITSPTEDCDRNLTPVSPKTLVSKSLTTESLNVRETKEDEISSSERQSPEDMSGSTLMLDPSPPAGNAIEKQIHSTPVAPRRPSELNFPTCTPIGVGTSRKSVVESPTSPGTSEDSISRRTSKAQHDVLRKVVLNTQLKNQFHTPAMRRSISQIEGPTLDNTYGFKVTQQNLQDAKALHEIQNLTVISMELHVRTRRELRPDPEYDPICMLFYCLHDDGQTATGQRAEVTGVIIVDKDSVEGEDIVDVNQPSTSTAAPPVRRAQNCRPLLPRSGVTSLQVTYVAEEKELVQHIAQLIRQWDPDILVGYEVQMLSWGYLLQRAATLDMDLCPLLSRVPDAAKESTFSSDQDEWGADQMSEINIVGRIVINVWRLMRRELALNNYTFENVAFHAMHQRVPLYSFRTLSDWFDNKTDLFRWRTVDHFVTRCRGNLQLLEQMDLIGRTSELARLFGIQFYHVLTRGSQYRVESMMLRIAKPMNYIAVSPSMQQRARQRAPECLPLILEPESRFYTHPVLVLDFQSLYPSIIIAYNYCYTTCLGRVEHLAEAGEFEFGCSSLKVPPATLRKLQDRLTVSPNGVAFVTKDVRKGILPGMLQDILNTRIMVKKSMKDYKQDKNLTRMLHSRQLGLKLIANVTYGYTSASFSGRMACIEIADSIVRKARETLERAIRLVNDTPKWGARVVYGDTDSMFVLLKGASKDSAFQIGQEIAETVTAANPQPVKLKFEKVYLPCVLQTKKRYVGYMYETPDQREPEFDAKGIETVRRDGCPAASKILECSLKTLFTSKDVSQVRRYVERQCTKLLEGRASMQDCIIAKEYRGMAYYRPTACVPALEITRRLLSSDRRAEPRVGERVPYVIVYGSPGLPLIQLVRQPHEVLTDPNLRLNATYYINKQILPALNRVFSLIGVDVFSWYRDLPRTNRFAAPARLLPDSRKGTISQFFQTVNCPVCNGPAQQGICTQCQGDPQQVAITLNCQIRAWERAYQHLLQVCQSCTGSPGQPSCISLDCPVLYKYVKARNDVERAPYFRELLDKTLDG